VIILARSDRGAENTRGIRVTDFSPKGLSLDVLVEWASIGVVQLPGYRSTACGGGSAGRGRYGETILVVTMSRWSANCSVQFLSSAAIGRSA